MHVWEIEIMDIGSLICTLSFWGGESVPTSKIGHCDIVALNLTCDLHRSMSHGEMKKFNPQ